MGVFYAENGLIGPLYPEWLLRTLNVLIGLFLQIGLMANIAKSKTMMCQTGTIKLGV